MPRVTDLDDSVIGRRIRVTHVAVGMAESVGLVHDTERLLGQEGLVENFTGIQLWVKWDSSTPGSLMLAELDEVEVLSA